jgi:hypothetical protein
MVEDNNEFVLKIQDHLNNLKSKKSELEQRIDKRKTYKNLTIVAAIALMIITGILYF